MSSEKEVSVRLVIGMVLLSLICISTFVGYGWLLIALLVGSATFSEIAIFAIFGGVASLAFMNLSARVVGWVTTIGMKPVDTPS